MHPQEVIALTAALAALAGAVTTAALAISVVCEHAAKALLQRTEKK